MNYLDEISDLDGISDRRVIILYRVAKMIHNNINIPPTTKKILNTIINVITTTKPCVDDIASRDQLELRLWYNTLTDCDKYVGTRSMSYLAMAEDTLASIIQEN